MYYLPRKNKQTRLYWLTLFFLFFLKQTLGVEWNHYGLSVNVAMHSRGPNDKHQIPWACTKTMKFDNHKLVIRGNTTNILFSTYFRNTTAVVDLRDVYTCINNIQTPLENIMHRWSAFELYWLFKIKIILTVLITLARGWPKTTIRVLLYFTIIIYKYKYLFVCTLISWNILILIGSWQDW